MSVIFAIEYVRRILENFGWSVILICVIKLLDKLI